MISEDYSDSGSVSSKSSVETSKQPRKASEAQIKHRALFAQWARSKSGMKFGEWKAKQSEVRSEVVSKREPDWFKKMIEKKNKK
jgi:hypothetical protein